MDTLGTRCGSRTAGSSVGTVVPYLVLPGALIGRWWVVALAALLWPAFLLVTDVGSGPKFAIGTGALGAANTAVGVGVHNLFARLLRRSSLAA